MNVSFKKNYDLLVHYLEHNNGFYPVLGEVYCGVKLGDWVNLQRVIYNNGEVMSDGSRKYNRHVLSKEQIGLLDKINFVWKSNTFDMNWNYCYGLFLKYLSENNGRYPAQRVEYEGFRLGSWISLQRETYNNGEVMSDGSRIYNGHVLSNERIHKLEMIDFIWDMYDDIWKKCFYLLIEYLGEYKEYPRQNVLYKGVKLGDWVHTQRKIYLNGERFIDGSIKYNRDLLTSEQIELLESINFRWYVYEKPFEKKIIKSRGVSQGIERYLLIKYKSLLELKMDVNEVTSMVSRDMLKR